MNFLTSDLPSTLILIGIGVVIGAALSKILNRGPKASELQQKLEDTQEQFNHYQKDVSNHFQKTAELVNNLTQSYQEVHQHLSQGAQSLAEHTPNALENNSFKALSDNQTPPESDPTDLNESVQEQADESITVTSSNEAKEKELETK